MEKQGKYREALELLERLDDDDFIIPGHPEITGETEDGRFIAEWCPPRPIGNRRLAMMRCRLGLGSPKEAVALAWETLEAGTADASAFACISGHPELQGGFAQIETRLHGLRNRQPGKHVVERCLDYVKVERDLSENDFESLVARIRSGASKRDSEGGPAAELKEYVVTGLLRRGDEAVPHLIEALDPRGQTIWIVYGLGLSKDERAIEPLFDHLLDVENYYERNETVLALSRLGEKAALYATGKLASDDSRTRESAAEVLSKCSGDVLEKADPGLRRIFALLRKGKNRVNIPVFLLRAVGSTRNRAYAAEVRRIKSEVGSFGAFGDRQYLYTLAHLGDTSVVPELIEGLDGMYAQFAQRALEAATGRQFPSKREWRQWWEKTGPKNNAP